MLIRLHVSRLRNTKWHEYALRFVIGGTITVFTGLLSQWYGPAFGGLFLAFPAIFPATVTLIQKHERQRGERAGVCRLLRALGAAALDARGAAIGSLGLVGFAVVVWKLAPRASDTITLVVAVIVWLMLSTVLWQFRRRKGII